ncbi:hypothetical protein KCP69_13745 [Salmonella enterica subsp. enterica]|nr:hypothetical protein KCP69_13745 [Salmonella enterica subsp. enterica]
MATAQGAGWSRFGAWRLNRTSGTKQTGAGSRAQDEDLRHRTAGRRRSGVGWPGRTSAAQWPQLTNSLPPLIIRLTGILRIIG